mgnify:CR=1 FL=1
MFDAARDSRDKPFLNVPFEVVVARTVVHETRAHHGPEHLSVSVCAGDVSEVLRVIHFVGLLD